MRSAALILALLLLARRRRCADSVPADTTAAAPPAYLEDLRKLAEASLAAGDSESAAAPLARRVVRGPISRAEYEQYVGEARFHGAVESDSVALTRPVIPRVVIRDRQAIGYLYTCCAYDEAAADSIDFVEIYDVSRGGFSNGDMMVVHPSGHSYILEGLDARFLESAAGWDNADNLRFRAFHRENAWMDAARGRPEGAGHRRLERAGAGAGRRGQRGPGPARHLGRPEGGRRQPVRRRQAADVLRPRRHHHHHRVLGLRPAAPAVRLAEGRRRPRRHRPA